MTTPRTVKQKARKLAKDYGLLYTEALVLAQATHSSCNRAYELSPEQNTATKQACGALQQGSTVVVYGGAATGKSTLLHAILELLAPETRVLWTNRRELPLGKSAPTYYHGLYKELPLLESSHRNLSASFLGFDEPDEAAGEFFGEKPAVLTLHALTLEDAQWCMSRLLGEQEAEARRLIFIRCFRDASTFSHRALTEV